MPGPEPPPPPPLRPSITTTTGGAAAGEEEEGVGVEGVTPLSSSSLTLTKYPASSGAAATNRSHEKNGGTTKISKLVTGSSNRSGSEKRHHHHHHHRRGNMTTNGTNIRLDMYDSYQTWALKTYGDSAKTKTVTRKKYNRILKILKGEEHNNAENSKFRFWVKAKGFRVGPPPGHLSEGCRSEQGLLYVPYTQVKSAESNKGEGGVFKKVAVVENFFDIIYDVHVEMDGRGGKHAGQKRTYKAIAETYAFLPREAVTNFLMQCSDCQKRMHAGSGGGGGGGGISEGGGSGSCARVNPTLPKQNVIVSVCSGPQSPINSHTSDSACSDPPEIDFSIPITTTYMKHLRNMGFSTEEALNLDNEECASNEQSDSSLDASSPHPIDDEMSPYTGKDENDKSRSLVSPCDYDGPIDMSKSESSVGIVTGGERSRKTSVSPSPSSPLWANGNNQPLNMSLNSDGNRPLTSSSSSSIRNRHHHHHNNNHHHHHHQSSSSSSSVAPTGGMSPPPPSLTSISDLGGSENHRHHHHRRHSHHHSHHNQQSNHQDHTYDEDLPNGALHERVVTPEDLSYNVKDEDEEEEDEVDEKLDTQKCDPERLKAFNMFVRLFVDENLDRMVPISKQPKEKIQAIIDSCARQFPEFSERSRKRIRTYLKSCRRTKRCRDQNGWEPGRPTPPHLTSAMAEQILAAACDNESNNAKRMRLGLGPVSTSSSNERENGDTASTLRQTAALKAYSEAHKYGVATTNGTSGLYRMGSNNNSGNSPNHYTSSQGPADLSIKKSSSPPQPPAKCPLNPSEVSAVRQLIAGYRESAAFLVRSADELEQLLLQQN